MREERTERGKEKRREQVKRDGREKAKEIRDGNGRERNGTEKDMMGQGKGRRRHGNEKERENKEKEGRVDKILFEALCLKMIFALKGYFLLSSPLGHIPPTSLVIKNK